eukprot:313206_1
MSTLTNLQKDIQLTIVEQYEDQGYEQKDKLYSTKKDSNASTAFVEPRESDYIDCQTNHGIEKCNVAKRILHLLLCYQQNDSGEWYEYLTSLKNYNVAVFMEDWHQVKDNHLRGNDNNHSIEWIKNMMNTECHDLKRCKYVSRYKRDRGNKLYDPMEMKIDYKDMIIMDKFDSIHTFIFHSTQRRNARWQMRREIQFKSDQKNDEKVEEKHQQQQFIDHAPESIIQCSTQHILSIINDDIFDALTPQARRHLTEYKSQITNYIKQNSIDGNKLKEMKRKHFINTIATHLENIKLKGSLGQLYNALMKYHPQNMVKNNSTQNVKDIWYNKPQSIPDCNVDQIQYITNDIIINKVYKLGEYKQNILNYMKQDRFDGGKLQKMKRKQFLNDISAYLNNTKTKAPLGTLYTEIMKYDIPTFKHDKMKDNTWPPTSIDLCNVDEIVYILDYIIENEIKKLTEVKSRIINYITQHTIDGDKLYQMKSEEFAGKLAAYLDNNKLKPLIHSLHKNIMDCDLSVFTETTMMNHNNKFETKTANDAANGTYYSFGTRYRYTQNQQHHPFYVLPKYHTIKEELHEYFSRMHESEDTDTLLLRSTLWIEKLHLTMEMASVKKMKASWYQGINGDHQIYPCQPISSDHVLALILYSQISQLCTKFRETYRKASNTEDTSKQLKRHAVFAHFGRLLYESFVFYGCRTSKVQELYHGMST